MEAGSQPEDKPNVVVISQQFNDLVGVTILANLVDVLRPISQKIFTISGNFNYPPVEKVHIINIKGVGLNEPTLTLLFKQILVQLRAAFGLLKILKSIDVVIFFLGGRIYALPMLLAKLARRKTVVVAGGSAAKTTRGQHRQRLFGLGGAVFSAIAGVLEKTNLCLADQIAVETEGAIHLLGLDKYRGKVAVYGSMYVDTNAFRVEQDVATKRDVVGYIGRLSGEKGVLNFVQAMPLILGENNDIEFLIGGGGQLFDDIEKEIKTNDLEARVTLTGWIAHEELPKYMNRLKVVVVPSYTEGLPGIVQEAMACGAVVVATPVGGIPDLVKDEETGFILEDNSPECISRNVLRALNYPKLDRIVKNARKLIEDEYGYNAMVEKSKRALYGLIWVAK